MIKQQLTQQAVTAALNHNWDDAISINKQLLVSQPNDIPTLNRLAKAYSESNMFPEALECYQAVLKKDPYNSIAKRNAQLLKQGKFITQTDPCSSSDDIMSEFISEPGKTKIVDLTRLANKDLLVRLCIGQIVELEQKKRAIQVKTKGGERIGQIVDTDSVELQKGMSVGNEYTAAIKYVDQKQIRIFIRESSRVKEREDVPTFI